MGRYFGLFGNVVDAGPDDPIHAGCRASQRHGTVGGAGGQAAAHADDTLIGSDRDAGVRQQIVLLEGVLYGGGDFGIADLRTTARIVAEAGAGAGAGVTAGAATQPGAGGEGQGSEKSENEREVMHLFGLRGLKRGACGPTSYQSGGRSGGKNNTPRLAETRVASVGTGV